MSVAPSHEEILHATRGGIIVTDADARIVFINQPAFKLLSFNEADPTGSPVTTLLPISAPLVIKCLQTGEPQLGCHIMGKSVDLVVNVTAIVRDGRIIGAVCHFQGMQEFQLSAQKVHSYKNLNRELQAIFRSSSDGIWVCDGQGNVIDINQASERLNGVPAADVIGENVQAMVDRGIIDRSVTLEVLETQRQVSIVQHVRRTGKYLLVTGTPTFDEKAEIFLVVVNERDMTQLNALRTDLEQSRRVTEKYKDELAKLNMLELATQEIIAESPNMRRIIETALKLATITAATILVLGESGTGKGMLAKLIHKYGSEAKAPFVRINCAAVPESLLEAELFGYEKGAFTGARQEGKVGLFELANGGTLFLDEIGDLPFSLQAKLLTYLDDKEILPLGAIRPRKVSCRIIAATNRNLEKLVKTKRFRQDLFYRLNGFTLSIPPLRQRRDDIFGLISHFLDVYNQTYGRSARISPKGLKSLLAYPFPGNVRELKNMLKKAVVMSDATILDEFLLNSMPEDAYRLAEIQTPATSAPKRFTKTLLEVERQLLESALTHCRSTRQLAAYLGVSQPTVVRKLKRHGLTIR